MNLNPLGQTLEPVTPRLNGSPQTVRRPFRQSSITLTCKPAAFSAFSSTPGHRSSNGSRSRVSGMIPHVNESA